MIPEASPRYNDLVDVLTQSATKTVQIEQKDGTVSTEQVLDEEILWWKTLDVSDEHFSRFAFELKEFERQAQVAYSCMPKERADQNAKDILQIAESYRRAIDAKGSESRRDKHNGKQTVFDKVGRNRIERVYRQEGGEKKRSLLDSLSGKQKDDDMEND